MRFVDQARCLVVVFITMVMTVAHSETVYYELVDVMLEDGTQLAGTFSWTYTPENFENGAGQFIFLDVPHTTHDHTDLDANIDPTQLIEITYPGSVHDDGVDIALVLSIALTPSTSAPLVLGAGESKYEIGGNGFYTGLFQSGHVAPVNPTLAVSKSAPNLVTLAWEPDLPGYLLQESGDLTSDGWTNSPSGSTNPVVIPSTGSLRFFRLKSP